LPYRTVIRNDTRKQVQLGKKCEKYLCVSISPLDALIIPNASHECKSKYGFFADISVVFLFIRVYHSAATSHICYNIFMSISTTSEFVQLLRERLAPVKQVSFLSDAIEGQRPDARKAAVLIALFEQEQEIFLAFIRRASTLRAHSGEIAFPGGGVDRTDTSPIMTALREAQEEIGLNPSRVEVLGVLPPVFTVVSNYLVMPVVAFLPHGLGNLSLQESEVAELILLPWRGLADPTIAHTEEWTRGGMTRTVYFYDYRQYRVWGATARILSTLLNVVGTSVGTSFSASANAREGEHNNQTYNR
jgi:8-oxo-dGTP pyrophosphatase MutT (NUDIX family)